MAAAGCGTVPRGGNDGGASDDDSERREAEARTETICAAEQLISRLQGN
jgi:hypothetical protein